VHALEVLTGQGADLAARGRRPSERDHADARVGHERLADLGSAGQHVQQACRQARFLEDAGQDHAAADGGARVRLQHDRVAERKRRGDRPDCEDLREVERRDDADHADWHTLGEAQVRLLARQQLTIRPGRQGRGLEDLLGRHVRLELGGRRDLAALTDAPVLDLGGVREPDLARLAQDRRALGIRQRGPCRLGCGRGCCGGGYVGWRCDADAGQLCAGRWLDHRPLAAAWLLPAAGVRLALPDRSVEESHQNSFGARRLAELRRAGDSAVRFTNTSYVIEHWKI
jgi:hypothetical protein